MRRVLDRQERDFPVHQEQPLCHTMLRVFTALQASCEELRVTQKHGYVTILNLKELLVRKPKPNACECPKESRHTGLACWGKPAHKVLISSHPCDDTSLERANLKHS